MTANIDDIVWGDPPPEPATSRRNPTRMTAGQLAVAAAMRPGEWGSYDLHDTSRARVTAVRLRDRDGLEAVARSTKVWFRTLDAVGTEDET